MKPFFHRLLRLLPLFLLAIAIGLVFYFKLDTYINAEAINTHQDLLLTWIHDNYLMSVGFFILLYILIVALSIPVTFFLALTAGFLFGTVPGMVYVVAATTLGTTCVFLIVRFSLATWLAEKNSKWISRMRQGFQENAFQYLLFLRLMPIFPSPVVNIVPGILDVKKSTFIISTFLGVIPGSFVYSMLGNGLSYTIDDSPHLSMLFEPPVFLPLIGLTILSLLVPFVYKRLKARRMVV